MQHPVLAAKPGRVVGPGMPYENGNVVKDTYDSRALVRNTALPPQVIPSAYCYHRSSTEKTERSVAKKQTPKCGIAAKLLPDIAINIDSSPFYMTRAAATKMDHPDDRVVIDTNLLQKRAQYGGLGIGAPAAANLAAAHRKVGSVQYGMAKMY